MNLLELQANKKLNGSTGELLLNVELQIQAQQIVALFGDSGAGKTTILRMIAGLTTPDSGSIRYKNTTWFDSSTKINVPIQSRNIGFVFQDYALFPNMTIKENLLFALPDKDFTLVNRLLVHFGLEELQYQKITQLSGGQQQRVALARALARKPNLLLLDEPLSALDNQIRNELQTLLRTFQKEQDFSIVLISHDLGEVYKMADYVYCIENGKVSKSGTTEDVFLNSKSSNKFQVMGEIVDIQNEDVVAVVTLVADARLVKVIATQEEALTFAIGDKVSVAAKAFNPIISKMI